MVHELVSDETHAPAAQFFEAHMERIGEDREPHERRDGRVVDDPEDERTQVLAVRPAQRASLLMRANGKCEISISDVTCKWA